MKKIGWYLPPSSLWVLSLLGFFGAKWWLFDLLANFRWHYVLSATGLVIIMHWLNKKRIVTGVVPRLLTIAVLVFNLILVCNLYFLPQRMIATTPELTILFSNIYIHNPDPSRLLPYIDQVNPDVIALAEVSDQQYTTFSEVLKTEYPYSTHRRERRSFGVALFSKYPPQNTEYIKYFHPEALPSLQFDLLVNQEPITVVVTHPYPPVEKWMTQQRNQQLIGLAEAVKDYPRATIVVGDFNITPWSPIFQKVLTIGKLRNSLVGAGYQPSWPSWLPAFLKIPIDHALFNHQVAVVDRYLGPDIGSDHVPVVIKVAVEN